MSGILENIESALGPVVSSTLGHAVIGLAILIIGLFVVKLICGMFKKLLSKVEFLDKHDLQQPILSLIKAVLTIFVLMAVLQHFGLTDVLAPLKNMVDQFLAAVPRIIGAGVVGYAGWVIAKIVSELVGVGLGSVDEQLALRTGNEDLKVSKFGSAFIFGGILLPIVVAALGVLNIPSITVPATEMINELMAAVPNIVGAGIVVYMLTGLLDGMGVNDLPNKLGIGNLFSESFTANKLIGSAIMFFSMLTATTAAVNLLGIEVISNIFAKVLEFGGGILVGGVAVSRIRN